MFKRAKTCSLHHNTVLSDSIGLFLLNIVITGMSSIELTIPQLLLTNFPHFRELYGSLPHPQQPATCLRSKLNQLHDLSFYLFKIHFNIILPSTARSSKCSLSFRFASQKLNFTHNPIICNYIHWTTEGMGNKTVITNYFNKLHRVTF